MKRIALSILGFLMCVMPWTLADSHETEEYPRLTHAKNEHMPSADVSRETMISNAYRNVLLRDPDPAGLSHFKEAALRDLDTDQESVEASLARSPEGMRLKQQRKKQPQTLRSAIIAIAFAVGLAWLIFAKHLQLRMVFLLFILLYPPFVIQHGFSARQVRNEDFPSFYGASRVVFALKESPYTPEGRKQVSDATGGHAFPYLYPPTSLPVFWPLSNLSFDDAKDAVLATNHLLYLAVLFLCFFFVRQAGRAGPSEQVGVACLVFYAMFDPIRSTIFHGQVNLLVLSLILASFLLSTKQRDIWAMVCLAGAIVLKTYPAILVLLLLAQRRYRAVALLASILLAWLAACFFILPSSVWGDWLTEVLPSGGYGKIPVGLFSPANIWNQNLNGFFSRMFINGESSNALFHCPILGRVLTYLCSISLLASATWLCHRTNKRHGDRFAAQELALFLTVMFLVSPLSWFHHLVFVLPACFVVIQTGITAKYRTHTSVLQWGALGLLAWHWYLWPDSAVMLRQGWGSLLASSRFYGVLVILGFLTAELVSSIRNGHTSRR